VSLCRLWLSWRSWVASLFPSWLKRGDRASKPLQEGDGHPRGGEVGQAPDPAPERQTARQAIFQKEFGVRPSLTAWGPHPLSDERDLQQEVEKAVGQVLHSLRLQTRVLDRDHLLQIALRLNERVAREKDQGHYHLAEALCQRALDIFDKVAVPEHPQLVEVLENYADLLHCVGRAEEAAPLEARAGAIRAKRAEQGLFRSLSPQPDSRIQKKGMGGESGIRSQDRPNREK
jgi:hypothetical protein